MDTWSVRDTAADEQRHLIERLWFSIAVRSYIALAAIGLLGACGGGAPSGDRVSTPSASPSVATFVDGGVCPPMDDGDFPPDAGCATIVSTDDGTLTMYALLDNDSRPLSWRMRFVSEKEDIEQRFKAGLDYPQAVGASDVDLDGRSEWWVRVMDYASHGAPWARLNLFFVDDGALVPLTFEGEPLGINYGGISRLGEGASCSEGKLVLMRTEAQDVRNTRWKVSERAFEIEGTTARFQGRKEGRLVIEDYNDPDLDPYYVVDCNGFAYP